MSGGGAGDDGRRQAARSARTAGSSASAGSASEGLARPDDDWLWKTEEVQAVVRLLDRNDELTARVKQSQKAALGLTTRTDEPLSFKRDAELIREINRNLDEVLEHFAAFPKELPLALESVAKESRGV